MMRGLHAEGAKRGLSHDGLHELVAKRYGVDSLAQLSETQLREWYREFTGKGFRHAGVGGAARRRAAGTAGRRQAGQPVNGSTDQRNVVELVSGDDLAMLADLAQQIGWSVSGLYTFVERQIGRSKIRTMAEFNKVLWAVKAIARRKGVRV
jgi:hypothetical protein